MAEELRENDEVQVTRTTRVESSETITTVDSSATGYSATAPTPRGAWDFTNTQRVILALLIWLNILMFAIGYLAVTGQLVI